MGAKDPNQEKAVPGARVGLPEKKNLIGTGEIYVPAWKKGVTVVITTPSGEIMGPIKCPKTISDLHHGTYCAKLSMPRHHDSKEICLGVGIGVTRFFDNVALDPAYGWLSVESNPENAKVYLDGKYLGKTPLPKVIVDSGDHILKLKLKSWYHDHIRELKINDNESTHISQKLTPSFGHLELKTIPEGAAIWINGKKEGKTGKKILRKKLASGTYYLTLKMKRYLPVEDEEIIIEDDKTFEKTYTLKPNFGTLTISSDPTGAAVFINGKKIGKTDSQEIRKNLPAGTYSLTLRKDLYLPIEDEKITIENGKTVVKTYTLKPTFGTLEVSSDPTGARVFINGEKIGKTNKQDIRKNLPSGTYYLTLKKDLYLPIEDEKIIIENGKTTTKTYFLKPNFGTLNVSSDPTGGAVYIDREKIGKANGIDIRLSPGKYHIKIDKNKEKWIPWEKDIYVEKSKTEKVEAKLERKKGHLTVKTDPPMVDAKIFLDKEKIKRGVAPFTIKNLETGAYLISARAEIGRETLVGSKTANVEWKKLKKITVRLKKVITSEFIAPSFDYRMIYIEPGEFMKGSPEEEEGHSIGEWQYQVEITSGFYMGATEVTVGQWRVFARDSGYMTEAEKEGWVWDRDSRYDPGWRKKNGLFWDKPGFSQKENHPVTCISWNDAMAFAKWLSKKRQATFRLPTPREWEYACRAGTDTAFYFGSCLSSDQANYHAGVPLSKCTEGQFRGQTTPVAGFIPNAHGLYDMHGNVAEWCSTWGWGFSWNYKAPLDTANGIHIRGPWWFPWMYTIRGIHGGGWHSGARDCRSAYYYEIPIFFRADYVGFRLVKPLPEGAVPFYSF